MATLARAALLIIDVQKAIDAPYHAKHGPRNNPSAESNIGRLLFAWRRDGRPVAPMLGETIVPKRTNSAFIGTDLGFTFARPDFRGRMRSADEVHCMSLANLEGEYGKEYLTSFELPYHIVFYLVS
jgi:hypothetical protein